MDKVYAHIGLPAHDMEDSAVEAKNSRLYAPIPDEVRKNS
jgi:hypothetical protein